MQLKMQGVRASSLPAPHYACECLRSFVCVRGDLLCVGNPCAIGPREGIVHIDVLLAQGKANTYSVATSLHHRIFESANM